MGASDRVSKADDEESTGTRRTCDTTHATQQIYDVAHNVAKVERYDGRELLVHRKGATRAFPARLG